MNSDKELKEIAKRAEENAKRIAENSYKIHQNTGALEVLHTIKVFTRLFFTMWLLTFVILLMTIGYIIFFLK